MKFVEATDLHADAMPVLAIGKNAVHEASLLPPEWRGGFGPVLVRPGRPVEALFVQPADIGESCS